MLKNDNYCITADNLYMHEFLGLKMKVSESNDAARKGFTGVVVDETKNTLKIENAGKEFVVPKAGNVFEFMLGNELVKLKGKDVAYSPQQRLKIRRPYNG